MSSSSMQGRSSYENLEEASAHTFVAAQIEALGQERSCLAHNSTVQNPLPRYTLNGLDVPVIEGIDPLAPTQTPDIMADATIGMRPVLQSTAPALQVDRITPPEYTPSLWGECILRTHSNYTLPSAALERISANRNAINTEPAQLTTILASQGIDGQDFQRRSVLFPYSEPQQRQTSEQRMRSERQQQQRQQESHNRAMRNMRDNPLPHGNHPETSILSLPQSREIQEHDSRELRERYAREGANNTDTLFPQSPHRRTSILSLPQQQTQAQREPRSSQALAVAVAEDTIDVPSPSISRQLRHSTAPAIPSQNLANSAVRYERIHRAHIQVEVRGQGQEQLGQENGQRTLSQGLLVPSRLPLPPARRHSASQGFPLGARHAHIESEQARLQSLVPDATPGASAPETPRPARNSATADAEELARIARRTARRARHDPSPSPGYTAREPRPDTDFRFRGLLRRFQSRAALPTPLSRPWHRAPVRQGEPHLRLRASSGAGPGASRVEWSAERVDRSMSASVRVQAGSNPNPLTFRTNLAPGSHASLSHRLSITPTLSNPHILALTPNRPDPHPSISQHHLNPTSQENSTVGPPPLTRAILENYARSSSMNPQNQPWHSLALLARVHNLHLRQAEQARVRIRERREARERARRRERVRARQAMLDWILEVETVDRAVMNLALCGALSDAMAVIARVADAEDEARTDSRSVRRMEREVERGWVASSQIVTPLERYALREALARRDALGERMGLLWALEDVLGQELGRWTFDVWVAQAASSFGLADSDSSSAAGRVGAVWLGPPGGNGDGHGDADGEEEMVVGVDGEDAVREWHFIPDNGDVLDGVGEGWVEWREAGQGVGVGCFVVHDVFR